MRLAFTEKESSKMHLNRSAVSDHLKQACTSSEVRLFCIKSIIHEKSKMLSKIVKTLASHDLSKTYLTVDSHLSVSCKKSGSRKPALAMSISCKEKKIVINNAQKFAFTHTLTGSLTF